MDRKIVAEKIESVRRYLARIEEKSPFNAADLGTNFDLQDIVSLNLQRAIQSSADLAAHLAADSEGHSPNSMAEGFEALRDAGVIDVRLCEALSRAVGLRNILVHEYGRIDWARIHAVIQNNVGDLRELCRIVAARAGI